MFIVLKACNTIILRGMLIHWVKCKYNEVKVFESLPVQENTCTSTAVGNAYTLGKML